MIEYRISIIDLQEEIKKLEVVLEDIKEKVVLVVKSNIPVPIVVTGGGGEKKKATKRKQEVQVTCLVEEDQKDQMICSIKEDQEN